MEKSIINEKSKIVETVVEKLKSLRRKIRKFQDGCNGNNTFDDFKPINDVLLIVNECTHVLVFDQRDDENNKVTRVFSCRRVQNDAMQVLTCFNSIVRNTSLDDKIRHLSHHICKISEMLKDCIGGCFFPYKLVNWIMGQMSIPIEQMFALSLNDKLNLLGC